MNIPDAQLRTYIDEIFVRYDVDRSGNLDARQLANFFNDLFKATGNNTVVTTAEAQNAITAIDQNNDGKANKMELFMAFKNISRGQSTPNTNSYGYNNPNRGSNYGQGPTGQYGYQQNPYQQQQMPMYNQNMNYGSQPNYNQPMQNSYNNQPNSGYGYSQQTYNQGHPNDPQGMNGNYGPQGMGMYGQSGNYNQQRMYNQQGMYGQQPNMYSNTPKYM